MLPKSHVHTTHRDIKGHTHIHATYIPTSYISNQVCPCRYPCLHMHILTKLHTHMFHAHILIMQIYRTHADTGTGPCASHIHRQTYAYYFSVLCIIWEQHKGQQEGVLGKKQVAYPGLGADDLWWAFVVRGPGKGEWKGAPPLQPAQVRPASLCIAVLRLLREGYACSIRTQKSPMEEGSELSLCS